MSEIILPAVYSGRKTGTMLIEPSGIRTFFTVRCSRPPEEEILRAWAVFDGAELLVGTMQPLDDGLFARRAFTRLELESAGADPLKAERAEIKGRNDTPASSGRGPPTPQAIRSKDSPGWQPFDPASIRVSDAALSRALREASDVLYKEAGDGFFLAAPLRRGKPFAFAPLFCLVRPAVIGGDAYGLLFVDGKGRPRSAAI